jgi:hypothetical protein
MRCKREAITGEDLCDPCLEKEEAGQVLRRKGMPRVIPPETELRRSKVHRVIQELVAEIRVKREQRRKWKATCKAKKARLAA